MLRRFVEMAVDTLLIGVVTGGLLLLVGLAISLLRGDL